MCLPNFLDWDHGCLLSALTNVPGEKLWRMPMEESYWEQMKSPIADMKNTGGRMGGAITAALFLREYVDTEKVLLSSPGVTFTPAERSRALC